MKKYFEKPMQVWFVDPTYEEDWKTGIAYRDEIICGCCGGIFEIEEVIEAAIEKNFKEGIYPYREWASLEDAIFGDEFPGALKWSEEEEKVIEK